MSACVAVRGGRDPLNCSEIELAGKGWSGKGDSIGEGVTMIRPLRRISFVLRDVEDGTFDRDEGWF